MAHILLIEPDRVLAGTYKQTLERAGHSVIPVSSAQAAIIAADYQTPDAIILELQLIEHSGIEFLYEFRSYPEWYNIPVIIQTQVPPAEFNTNQQLLRDQLNIRTYLYKPQTSLKQLLHAVTAIQVVSV
jgi:DNA-binding response OmpR family regulator